MSMNRCRRSPLLLTRACAVTTMMIAGWLVVGGDSGPMGEWGPAAAMASSPAPDDMKEIFKPNLPGNALEISTAARVAKVGELVTVRGYIPMEADTGSAKSMVFSLHEPQLPASTIAAAQPAGSAPALPLVKVKIVDANGQVMPGRVDGKQGLVAGAEVFVTGKIESNGGADGFTIAATAIHVPRSAMPVGVITATSAAGAQDISAARKAGGLKVGQEVVLRGRVGGAIDPFVPGRAVFTLVGRGLKACNENPDDACSKPWDYCCETKADIAANSATMQVVDGKGKVLRTDIKGRRGIKELSEITVVGKVAVADGKSLVVNVVSMSVVE